MINIPFINKNKKSHNKQTDDPFVLSKFTAFLLLLTQTLNLSTLMSQLAPWMMSVVVGGLVLRAVIILKPSMVPAKWLINALGVLGCVVLATSAKQLGLLLSMLHLLSFAYVLKSIELDKRRDFYQFILLGMFLLATSLIYDQSLLFSFAVITIVFVNLFTLLQYFSYSASLRHLMLTTSKLVVLSMPLAVVLFIVFPRLPPFWQMPQSKSATTGLSENVTPGDIANLALSSELAFRVTFEPTPNTSTSSSSAPQYSDLYWRALVFDYFDGRTWKKSDQSKKINSLYLKGRITSKKNLVDKALYKPSVSYQVISEPSNQQWLFGLDIAEINHEFAGSNTSHEIVELPDFTLQSRKIINKAISYNVNSYMTAPLELTLSDYAQLQNLLIPPDSNPQLVAEAQRLRALFSSDLDIIQHVLDNFREQTYFYTLQPPLLGQDSLDEFYFDTKSGFCAHYASAFTFIMRAAGIPARMVTGYLGGEFNPRANYYSIYQSDAHAWSEVWLPNKGWVRVDPTSAVDPERVERGFSSTLQSEYLNINDSIFTFSAFNDSEFLKAIKFQFAAVDYQWTRLVVGYSSKKQMALLAKWFGKSKLWKTALLIGMSIISTMLILTLLNHLRASKSSVNVESQWSLIYKDSLNLLAKAGLIKPANMSVSEFSNNVIAQNIEIGSSFNEITQCFIKLQYQELPDVNQKQIITKMTQSLVHLKKALKTAKKND